VSDKRCDDRECRVPPAYVAVHDTTRRGRYCAVRCSAVRGAGMQLPMRRVTPGRVYIGSRPGTSAGGEEKVDRRPNPTRHPEGRHAGQTARVAYGSVSPTGSVACLCLLWRGGARRVHADERGGRRAWGCAAGRTPTPAARPRHLY